MSLVKQHVVEELHKPARKIYPRRRVILKSIDDIWMSDLAELIPYKNINKGYKYLLVVIDCFSKFLWTIALKNKTGKEVTNAMAKILAGGRLPKNLQTDNGTEYYNSEFKKLMSKYKINHYSTYTSMKAMMAERVIRTIKNNLYKQFSLRGNYKWYDIIGDITSKYNSTVHRTIKMKPKDVNNSTIEKQLLNTVYSNIKIAGHNKYHIGDYVRISKNKAVFDKSYHPSWSTEIFKIVKVQITNPVTYLLQDEYKQPISGGFYEAELQNVRYKDVYLVEKILKQKADKVYVKWLGFNDTHNSWIMKSDLV